MSGKHRGGAHDEHMDETWLIPYADLLTLLLALFIVLYASSNIDTEKYNAMQDVFHQMIMEGKGLSEIQFTPPTPSSQPPSDEAMARERLDLRQMQAELQEYLEERGLENQVSTTIDDRGLVISMNDAVLFDPGMAVVKQEYRYVLIQIGEIIGRLNNYIRVEGHTDNVPQSSVTHPTNWELSGGRATSVVRIFEEESHLPPQRLMAVGYGEFRPIAGNDTAEGRGKNRRVDVIILSSYFNALEDQRVN